MNEWTAFRQIVCTLGLEHVVDAHGSGGGGDDQSFATLCVKGFLEGPHSGSG